MPARRSEVEIVYPELPQAQRSCWLIVDPSTGVELCQIDPGFDVDLYVSADLRSMMAIWLDLDTVRAAVANQRMVLTGKLAASMQRCRAVPPMQDGLPKMKDFPAKLCSSGVLVPELTAA